MPASSAPTRRRSKHSCSSWLPPASAPRARSTQHANGELRVNKRRKLSVVAQRARKKCCPIKASLENGQAVRPLVVRAMLAGTVLVCALVGCGDPVHDTAVSALGPEAPGVPKGPLHRPGQPCVLCHGPQGSATTFLL